MSRRKEEPASLAAVKVRRAPRRIEGSDKAGDITAQLLPPNAPPPELQQPRLPRSPPPAALLLSAPVTITPVAPVTEIAHVATEPVNPVPPEAVLPPAPFTVAPLALEMDAEPLVPLSPPPAQLADEIPAPPAKPHEYWEFIDYWNRLRRDRPVPALTLLDRELVAECWPDSLMVTYVSLDASVPQVARLSKPTGEIQYTPMVTEWIISCARQVARYGEAMEDEQEFPLTGGTTGYRLLLLPFAGAQGENDHVLCHLSRAPKDGAARF